MFAMVGFFTAAMVAQCIVRSAVPQSTVRGSAADQIALARSLVRTALHAPEESDRREATAKVAEILDLVPRLWPDDRPNVIAAALLEGDLLLATNAPEDALSVLQRTVPVANNGRDAATIHLRMGRAYSRLHDYRNAESVLLTAEEEVPVAANDLAMWVQGELAEVLSSADRPRDAAARYRRLAAGARDATLRAEYFVKSAQQHFRAGDGEDARCDLDEASKALAEAKNGVRRPREIEMQEDLERLIQTLRSTQLPSLP